MPENLRPAFGRTYTAAQISVMLLEDSPAMMVDIWAPSADPDLIIDGQAMRECYSGAIQDANCPCSIGEIPGFEDLLFVHMRTSKDGIAQFRAEPTSKFLELCDAYLVSEDGPEYAFLWITPKAYPQPVPSNYHIIRKL